jgi:hypothetical protein
MTQSMTRLYDSYDTALRAALALKEAGFTEREISMVAGPFHEPEINEVAEDAETGAAIGGVIGAAAGLMAGLGVLAIPGIGPVVAAGWLALRRTFKRPRPTLWRRCASPWTNCATRYILRRISTAVKSSASAP